MNKEKFLRVYNRINIAFGVMLILFVVMFISQFPTSFNGLVEKNLFVISIENYEGIINILNAPLFVFVSLFLLNIYLLIRVKDTNVENKYLQNVMFYNIMILLMLIVGHLVFYFSVPDVINGEVANKFLYVRFQLRSNEFQDVINVNYVLSGIFLIYNLFVAYKSPNPQEETFDEELFTDQYYKSLNKD